MSTTEVKGIQRDDTVHDETYFTAADMATAEVRGFRDGQAAQAAAGQDPVVAEESRLTGDAKLAHEKEIARLREALQFYADRHHFMLSDDSAWDTVSDEPQNLWCDLAGTATVEDGFFARAALAVTIATSQTPPDHNRAAFEHRLGGANFKRDAHGNYVNEFVRCKWWGWCAHADEVRETGVKQ